jgi:hypothetical protein
MNYISESGLTVAAVWAWPGYSKYYRSRVGYGQSGRWGGGESADCEPTRPRGEGGGGSNFNSGTGCVRNVT